MHQHEPEYYQQAIDMAYPLSTDNIAHLFQRAAQIHAEFLMRADDMLFG